MRPPRAHRPGFSRRRQFSLFLAQVVAVVGVFLALALVLTWRFDPPGLKIARGAAIDAGAPVSATLRSGLRGGRSLGEMVGDYLFAGAQNASLRAELGRQRRELVQARADRLELVRLKQVVRLVEPISPPVAVARIVAASPSGPRRLAVLTAGSLDGVRPGQPVRAAEGLVGRVLEVGHTASRVLLIGDEGNVVPVRVARDGTPALVTGTGGGGLDVKALTAGGSPFRRGDLLVTSGTGGLYPPGVPVGILVRANGDGGIAQAMARPDRLDFAVVTPVYQVDLSVAPAAKAAR